MKTVLLTMCDECAAGAGGFCNSAGCAFVRSQAPDLPISPTPAEPVIYDKPPWPNAMPEDMRNEYCAYCIICPSGWIIYGCHDMGPESRHIKSK